MRWLSVVVLLGACVDMDDSGSSIVGTSGDVQTEPGDYVGYRVVTPCEQPHYNVGVIGTGSIAVTDIAEIKALASELGAMVRDINSVWGYSGYGLVCEPGIGTSIHTNSWQEVDLLIARTGDFLRERDLSLQVAIGVGGTPVPH